MIVKWSTTPPFGHNYETEKITCKASDVAEYIELFGSSAREMHDTSERPPIYASSCMTISRERTEPNNSILLQVFCHVTGFMGNFRPSKTIR